MYYSNLPHSVQASRDSSYPAFNLRRFPFGYLARASSYMCVSPLGAPDNQTVLDQQVDRSQSFPRRCTMKLLPHSIYEGYLQVRDDDVVSRSIGIRIRKDLGNLVVPG